MKEKEQDRSLAKSNCLPQGNRQRRLNKSEKLIKNNLQLKTAKQKLSFSKDISDLYKNIISIKNYITDECQNIIIRTSKKLEIEKFKPNISIVASYRYPYRSEVDSYNRDEAVARLNVQTAVFIRTFILFLMPELRNAPYEKWPPFMAFLEHFDEDGKLRAPHYHIVIRVPVEFLSLITSRDFISYWKNEWSKVVRDLDQDLFHIQQIDWNEISETAIYVTKQFLRDGYEDSNLKIRRAYGWSARSLSSLDWYFDNQTFYRVLTSKDPVRRRKPKSHSQRMEEKANFEKVSENIWDTAKPYDQVWSNWDEMAAVPRKKSSRRKKISARNF